MACDAIGPPPLAGWIMPCTHCGLVHGFGATLPQHFVCGRCGGANEVPDEQ